MDVKKIWEFEPSGSSPSNNRNGILKNKELVDTYADHAAKSLMAETLPRLNEIAANTKEAIFRYSSVEIQKSQEKINEYMRKLDESPNFSRLIQGERNRIVQIRRILKRKIEDVERDFDINAVVELVGIALVVPNLSSEIKIKLERPSFVPKYSDFSKLNQQINTENSEITHSRMQQDLEEWIEYHRLYREARREWKILPYEQIIKRINQKSPRLKVGDFGCGEAIIMQNLGENRVFSCDHIAINDKVTACEMKSVPLPDGNLDIIVFSLSLMGKNWADYITEARRCLWNDGILLIGETTNALTEGRLLGLRELLRRNGFIITRDEENDSFTFIEAKKVPITSL